MKDIEDRVRKCFGTPFDLRVARTIPRADKLALHNGCRHCEGAVLYSDVVQSSVLAAEFDDEGAAKIIQAFIVGSAQVIKYYGGTVTAYDGDRVMAVFDDDQPEVSAVHAALCIGGFVGTVLNPVMNEFFGLPRKSQRIRHCSGVDRGDMLAVKIGIRGNSDLLWSGRPANYAAKMSSNRDPFYPTVVSGRVFQKLDDQYKRTRDVTFWKRFRCEAVGMDVFGTELSFTVKDV